MKWDAGLVQCLLCFNNSGDAGLRRIKQVAENGQKGDAGWSAIAITGLAREGPDARDLLIPKRRCDSGDEGRITV